MPLANLVRASGCINTYKGLYVKVQNDQLAHIEIKGFWWGDDLEKMECIREQHKDKKLVVIFGKVTLDKICENIKENLPLEPVWSW